MMRLFYDGCILSPLSIVPEVPYSGSLERNQPFHHRTRDGTGCQAERQKRLIFGQQDLLRNFVLSSLYCTTDYTMPEYFDR